MNHTKEPTISDRLAVAERHFLSEAIDPYHAEVCMRAREYISTDGSLRPVGGV